MENSELSSAETCLEIPAEKKYFDFDTFELLILSHRIVDC